MENASINITGHHIEITPALRSYITKRFTRLHKRGEHITSLNVTLEVNKLQQIAKANLHVRGADFHASAEETDMYAAIDLLVDKLSRQIRTHRETVNNHG